MRIQSAEYWSASNFKLSESDIEQIFNHFWEVERPLPVPQLAEVVIAHRIAEEKNALQRRLAGRMVYQPRQTFATGDELVFPSLQFAQGTVADIRPGTNPQFGEFKVIGVEMNGKKREFAAELDIDHPLNEGEGLAAVKVEDPDPNEIYGRYGDKIDQVISASLDAHPEFVCLMDRWFVKGLMVEINVGHLHLSEAVLEMSEGGPLSTSDILAHLDMDESIHQEVKEFSLSHGLLEDERFDEVAPPGEILWFLRRLEPAAVRETPERLVYTPASYDPALLGRQLRQIERELDDEWSNLEPLTVPREVTLTLTYPHRWAGTLPLSARTRPLFPIGISARQIITLVDAETGAEMPAWVAAEGRYVYGLSEWYTQHAIPVGGFIKLAPSDRIGRVMIDFERRPRPRREWVRLASVEDGRLKFSLDRREIGCEYDDLVIVGTDYVAAVDAIFRSSETRRRSLASLLVEIMPSLAADSPQSAVHAKTLYSAVNMLRRVTPGVVFAELIRHPAFESVGDQYWQFNSQKWQGK